MTRDGEVSQDGRLHGAGGRAASPLSKPGKDSRGRARHSWRAGSRRELWPGQTRQEVEDQKGLWPEDRALSREGTGYQQGKTGAMGFPKAARGGRHPRKPHFLNRDRLGIEPLGLHTVAPKAHEPDPRADGLLLQLARPLVRASVTTSSIQRPEMDVPKGVGRT